MKFRVSCVGDSNAMYYGQTLRDFNLRITHENGEKYTDIELYTINDVALLQLAIGSPLIFDGNTIEIYDGYRE